MDNSFQQFSYLPVADVQDHNVVDIGEVGHVDVNPMVILQGLDSNPLDHIIGEGRGL